MFKKILIPLDGSDLAERALRPAFKIARQLESEVILLRAAHAQSMFPVMNDGTIGMELLWPEQVINRAQQESRDYLEALKEKYSSETFRLETRVIDEEPATGILNTAAREEIDLIVMSTHGYSGLTRWMLGSVAEKVLRAACCPTIIMRSLDPIEKILIPLDGSSYSEKALLPGLEAAGHLGAEVTLLHAVGDLSIDQASAKQLEPLIGQNLRASYHSRSRLYLERAAKSHQRSDLPIYTNVADGSPAESILEFVRENAIDMVVMATYGRTGLQHWVYGSVTEKVLRSGECSMFIVPPHARVAETAERAGEPRAAKHLLPVLS